MSATAITGAAVHGAFAAVFAILYFLAERNKNAASIAQSAFVVCVITATVNVLQLSVLMDAVRFYTLAWVGFSFSLFLMGQSLATFWGHTDSRRVFLGYVLALVGVLGAVGVYTTPIGAWVVVIAAFVLYLAFFAVLVHEKKTSRGWWVIVVFAAGTLTYIISYIVSFPVMQRDTVTCWEPWVYFIGNVITKIIVPISEWFYLRGNSSPPLEKDDTIDTGAAPLLYKLHTKGKRV